MGSRLTIDTYDQGAYDITQQVASCVSGDCHAVLVTALHTSCGIVVNEDTDGSIAQDLHTLLERLVPRGDYVHDDGNAHAHLRSILIGDRVTIPVEEGRLVMGTWQRILLVEFDGPRRRTVHVQPLEGTTR